MIFKNDHDKLIAYSRTFDTEHGKKVLLDLLDMAGIWRSIFDPDSSVMCFNEGQRNIGLNIMAAMEMTPEKLTDIQQTVAIQEIINDD